MANIIAVVWDCDKTLIDGYMQDPIFKEYGMEAGVFWKTVNDRVNDLVKNKISILLNLDLAQF